MIDTDAMRRTLNLAAGLLALACAATPAAPAERAPVDVDPDPECAAISETRFVTGILQRKDLGHGLDGLFLQTDEVSWLLLYSVPKQLEPLVGHQVEVTGKFCERGGRAIAAPHFNPRRIEALD